MRHELVFPHKYLYDGIQNIQFSDTNPTVLLRKKSRVYIDVKFTKFGTYQVYANVNFNGNNKITLQTGVMYPNATQYPNILSNKSIKKTIDNINVLVGNIYILKDNDLIQPIFVQVNSKLLNPIIINSITIKGNNVIEYPYTEWWDEKKNTGKRPYQHANHMVANSIFTNIVNPMHIYREMIILKWHIHTYATAINGPSTYMGIDFVENKIVFSVWNAVNDSVEIKNMIVSVGDNVESNAFDHEGSGSYFQFKKIKLMINNKYGFYVKFDEFDKNDQPNTHYSAYFIDLGPVDKPYETPIWNHIGTVKHYKIYNKESRIGGFVENFMTANGHLFQRSVAIGNGWMSTNGIDWVPSSHEEAVMSDLKMQQASIYDNDMIIYNIGGRMGTKDENLTHHGDLRAFDLYRDINKCIKPKSLNLKP